MVGKHLCLLSIGVELSNLHIQLEMEKLLLSVLRLRGASKFPCESEVRTGRPRAAPHCLHLTVM